MLPDGYPDSFAHDGLLDVWFNGIPWAIQRRVMDVDPKLRVIRNPVTMVYVVVLKLKSDEPDRHHSFFATAILDGWKPLVETRHGFPVEYVRTLCEGMEASAKAFDEKYGDTPDSITRGLKNERAVSERNRVAGMMQSTRLATEASASFMRSAAHGMTMGMSPRKRREKWSAAAREYAVQKERDARRMRGDFSLVVPR